MVFEVNRALARVSHPASSFCSEEQQDSRFSQLPAMVAAVKKLSADACSAASRDESSSASGVAGMLDPTVLTAQWLDAKDALSQCLNSAVGCEEEQQDSFTARVEDLVAARDKLASDLVSKARQRLTELHTLVKEPKAKLQNLMGLRSMAASFLNPRPDHKEDKEDKDDEDDKDNDADVDLSDPPFLDVTLADSFTAAATLHAELVAAKCSLGLQNATARPLAPDPEWEAAEKRCLQQAVQVRHLGTQLEARCRAVEAELEVFGTRSGAILLRAVKAAEARIHKESERHLAMVPQLEDLVQELDVLLQKQQEYKEQQKDLGDRYWDLVESRDSLDKEAAVLAFERDRLRRRKAPLQQINEVRERLAVAQKSIIHLQQTPEARRVHGQLLAFCHHLPELAWQFPGLHPLAGTSVQHYEVRSFETDYANVEELDSSSPARHKIWAAERTPQEGGPPVKVALKQYVDTGLSSTGSRLKELKKTVAIMGQQFHTNIVRLTGLAKSLDGSWYLEMELRHSDLRKWMQEKAQELDSLSPDARAKRVTPIAIGILNGLAFLHSQGIIHNDIKPENVVLDLNEVPALVDFDTSKDQNVATVTKQGGWTPGYVAPEISGGAPPSPQSDMYAFGVVLGELLGTDTESLLQSIHNTPMCLFLVSDTQLQVRS